MTDNSIALLIDFAWPLALALAWLAGEATYRWFGLPRISGYGIAGFALAQAQGGFLPNPSGGPIALLADFAFGLILFELGYRINLRWLRANPWLGVTSLAEAGLSFLAVFAVARLLAVDMVSALLLAALAMATSPAAILRVANDMGGSGQVTERSLHFSAFNSILALIVFKAIVGYWVLSTAGSLLQATWASVVAVLVSAGIGALFGVALSGLLRMTDNAERNATVAFALAVLLLTALTHALKFSPLLAAIAFGMVARHRRVVLTQAQRNFGVLGDLLTVLLFVFVAATLDWRQILDDFPLALAVVAARMLAKIGVTTILARPGGIAWYKGFLTGLALTPQSVFVILLLEQTRHLDIGWVSDMAGLAAIVLLLEVIGPLATRWALIRAGEARPGRRE